MSMTESERYTWWDDGEAYSNYIRPAVTKRLAEYEDIGTVSEFRELKEKATAKASYGIKCPHCNFYTSNGRYCCNCGKMLVAKSEGKE